MNKVCLKCKQELPTSEFWDSKDGKNGLQSQCKKCKTKYVRKWRKENRERIAEQQKLYRMKNRDKIRGQARERGSSEEYRELHRRQCLMRCYGLTPEQHKQFYINQNGCCAICRESIPYDKICVDHSHETERVRGLLCRKCNSGIGLLGDTVEGLRRAVEYLKEAV